STRRRPSRLPRSRLPHRPRGRGFERTRSPAGCARSCRPGSDRPASGHRPPPGTDSPIRCNATRGSGITAAVTANLEHDFAAWADRRDADALTRVFDATAGRLVLLAAHLAGPGAIAEDLVQATFLAAMHRAATWDRRRPVWPWLAAILHNQ